jgi:hypothetical protein
MHGRVATVGTGVVGVAGLALLGFEGVEAMRNVVLSDLATGLLFAGVGLIVIAAALAVAGLVATPSSPVPVAETALESPAEAPKQTARKRSAAASTATKATKPADATLVDREAEKAAKWTLVHRADCAGRASAGEITASVRRGATLIAYREGLEVVVGTFAQHRSWRYVTKVVANLAGSQATITVDFTTNIGAGQASFTGKTGDLAPIATALVSAAPAGIVDVTYG